MRMAIFEEYGDEDPLAVFPESASVRVSHGNRTVIEVGDTLHIIVTATFSEAVEELERAMVEVPVQMQSYNDQERDKERRKSWGSSNG